MLLALFINDFSTEIASSTTTGRHIAVTPLEFCDTLQDVLCECVGEKERHTDNVRVMARSIQ